MKKMRWSLAIVLIFVLFAPAFAACGEATYTVRYDANGGSGTMADSTHTYNEFKLLPENTFTHANYVFIGWCIVKDGSAHLYENLAPVINLTEEAGGTVTLYAQWRWDGSLDVIIAPAPGPDPIPEDPSVISEKVD
jgi:hypothetical protein